MIRVCQIYTLVSKIPRGKVVTYGQLARLAGIKSPRSLGRILHTNPDPSHIPCHRVVHADGSLPKGYAFGGKRAQQKKLLQEKVIFIKNRVDLASSQFIPKSSK